MKRLVVLLVLVALGGGAYWWYRSRTAPRVNVTPFAKLSRPEQQKRRVKLQNVESQVKAIARASKQGEKKPFEVTISQDELNTLLQDRLKTTNLPLENPRVGLQNGQLIVEADGHYKGLSAPVSVVGTVSAQNDDVAFSIESLTLSGFSLGDWKEKVQRAVDDGLKKALREKGAAKIDSVEIGDGTLTIKGRTG